MVFEELQQSLSAYKTGETEQNWLKGDIDIYFKNDYLKLVSIETSNRAGGKEVKQGKQWSIIIELYKPFENLPNWIRLKDWLKNELKITPVKSEKYSGKEGMRFYKMSQNPTKEIILSLLNFIFAQNEINIHSDRKE